MNKIDLNKRVSYLIDYLDNFICRYSKTNLMDYWDGEKENSPIDNDNNVWLSFFDSVSETLTDRLLIVFNLSKLLDEKSKKENIERQKDFIIACGNIFVAFEMMLENEGIFSSKNDLRNEVRSYFHPKTLRAISK